MRIAAAVWAICQRHPDWGPAAERSTWKERFLAITRLPFEAAGWIGSLAIPKGLLLALIRLCYIVGGCIMDALAFLLISLPIFYPLVVGMGYDPIWFGQVITIVTTMGAIMPPIGICCYGVAAMAGPLS